MASSIVFAATPATGFLSVHPLKPRRFHVTSSLDTDVSDMSVNGIRTCFMMNKFMQGRFLVGKNISRCRHPPPRREVGVFGMPMRVFEAIKSMQKLGDSERIKYGYLFSELLGLPKPPEISTNQEGKRKKFAVKLVKFEEYKSERVLREIALAKWDEEVKSMEEFEMKSWIDLLDNLPCVIKQGVTEKKAKKIIAKIEAAGGEAVMETLE